MDTYTSKNKSNGHSFHNSFQRSISPSGRFCSSSSAFSSFTARSGPLLSRPSSPTRVNLYRSTSTSPSIRFSSSSSSPNRSISVASTSSSRGHKKQTCACSPTTHPGSYRCRLHKNQNIVHPQLQTRSSHNSQLNMRRSAMTNSLVRIGTVEGELVKRALAALIRPSSHQLRRRGVFQRRPSRLSIMSKAEDL